MAVVEIPGSKSVTARALALAAGGRGETVLERPLHSDDTEAFAEGLRSLGYEVRLAPGAWTVVGSPDGPPAAEASVFSRDAGTAARFLPALAAVGRGTYRFDGSEQMRRRPVGPLVAALRAIGAQVTHDGAEGHLPITVVTTDAEGGTGGGLAIDASVSSQFLTALLLAAPRMPRGLRVEVTDMVSRPYVDMTVAMMEAFGVVVGREGDTFTVANQDYAGRRYPVEPDASTASYVFAAAALTGGTVTVPGLGRGALQGDLAFVDVLARMGADVVVEADRTTVTGTGRLRGLTVNMRDISDTMPTLAAIAPFADGPVRIEDVANTRVKESDRLEACAVNLRRLAIDVATGPDWIEIHPGTPRGAEIACFADHRIAMSFSVTGLRTPGLTLDDPACVRKTFPEFHEVFAALREQLPAAG
ncbi:3-phosphoshikimate 1-carboxyvinyltransferase [Cellulomonas carbonis]|uniref:3-phosphoshikimate 1-carboxyvinyltransferase n=1 Tax=Cellulomonas carbonis T26 TaxID=947969 RepID=A0A0A0BUG3_9CELL|nr:3-phosphoshikimate 1-carboxyvinyltransferase [Cellulomonas carbonis]KGM12058.1 3-phosphoshikimate 1-carboxyvinyltransferase [Cellulomonas carbonis T26]GGC08153.1 3-phosphoshikimate 1-carboxyvinyltransferase [Cellulomonas carbonis]